MTVIDRPVIGTGVTHDLYRDIHKGIRAELFATTVQAGSLDPGDDAARVALARRVRGVRELLVAHAAHEDTHVQPLLEEHTPALAGEVARAHARIETTLVVLDDAADAAMRAPAVEQRPRVHELYLDLALFTATYIEHEEVEERLVMPALEAAVGVDTVIAVHGAIVGSLPPDEMASSLAIMLPAMNVEDRTELLAGMQATAPATAFAGVWALARSVLDERDTAAVAARLGI
jgi:hypothetical protein